MSEENKAAASTAPEEEEKSEKVQLKINSEEESPVIPIK